MSSGPSEAPTFPAQAARHSLRPVSVGWRLVFATTVALAVFLGAGFAWAHQNLWLVLVEQVDALLVNKAQELGAVARAAHATGGTSALDQEIAREIDVYADAGLTVNLRRPDGTTLVALSAAGAATRAEVEALASYPLSSSPATIAATGSEPPRRAIRQEFVLPNGRWVFHLAVSLEPARDTLARFDRRVALGGLAFLLLAIPGGWWLARQALRPVRTAVEAARTLNPADLSARLPRTGAGDELDQLASTINDLLRRVYEYQTRIARFTADASHELRTPLATMRAAIDVVLAKPRSAADYHDTLVTLGAQCDRLTAVVSGLQLLARADAGQLQLERKPVDLSRLARACVELLQPLAEEKGLVLADDECRHEVKALGDAIRLRQVLTNLIDNAIKFTPAGGRVTVAARRDGKSATLVVADTGMGIPEAAMRRLFERFYRADSARTAEGSGLGLSICQTIVAAHGGVIDADSAVGKGTRFRVDLPALD